MPDHPLRSGGAGPGSTATKSEFTQQRGDARDADAAPLLTFTATPDRSGVVSTPRTQVFDGAALH